MAHRSVLFVVRAHTEFKNRDPNNVEFRGLAEKSGAVLVSYSFDADTPRLDGFRAAVGLDYLGDRPGDAPSGITCEIRTTSWRASTTRWSTRARCGASG
jgi:iron complex outermembrane receptor protein